MHIPSLPLRISTLLFLGGVAPAAAQEVSSVIQPEALEWTEIIPGVSFAAVSGDWQQEKHGKFIRIDPGVVTPMHSHTSAYHGIVISGAVTNPFEGDEGAVRMEPGAYWSVPGGAVHSTGCVSEEPCLVYTHADAAWDIQLAEGEAPPPSP